MIKKNAIKIQTKKKYPCLVRTLVRQIRPGDHLSLNYITPIFAENRSKLTSTQIPTRPRFAYQQQHYTDSVAAIMGSPYYTRDMDEPTSPAGGAHHRSRSASRPPHPMDYPSEYKTACLVARITREKFGVNS